MSSSVGTKRFCKNIRSSRRFLLRSLFTWRISLSVPVRIDKAEPMTSTVVTKSTSTLLHCYRCYTNALCVETLLQVRVRVLNNRQSIRTSYHAQTKLSGSDSCMFDVAVRFQWCRRRCKKNPRQRVNVLRLERCISDLGDLQPAVPFL